MKKMFLTIAKLLINFYFNKMSTEHSAHGEQNCTSLFCIENREEFRIGTYNEVSILYRVHDGFVNATKLCNDGGRDFRTFKKGQRWRKIIEYWTQQEQNERCANLLTASNYELKGKYDKSRGQYIHPDLIHFVAEWVSIEYAFKVKHIMDLINEKNQLLNRNLNDTISELTSELEQIKIQLNQLKSDNANLTSITQQQTKTIFDESVRVKNCRRRLMILKLHDGRYKFSANSSDPIDVVLDEHDAEYVYAEFTFPHGMPLKQTMNGMFGKNYYIKPELVEEAKRYIESKIPNSKIIIVDDDDW